MSSLIALSVLSACAPAADELIQLPSADRLQQRIAMADDYWQSEVAPKASFFYQQLNEQTNIVEQLAERSMSIDAAAATVYACLVEWATKRVQDQSSKLAAEQLARFQQLKVCNVLLWEYYALLAASSRRQRFTFAGVV